MKTKIFSVLLLLSLLFSCENDNSCKETAATYTVTFSFNWNTVDFPTDYPNGAHFSPLIGWSHKNSSSFFQENTFASEGIESMAETGATTILSNEINTFINNGEGKEIVLGNGLNNGTGEISLNISVDSKHSAITLASMLAPSPDWYVGIVNIDLLENDCFVESKQLQAKVYDAGTDDGNAFTSSDIDSNPAGKITLITTAPLGNGIEVNPNFCTVSIVKK